jgi:hypothetical protein
MHLNVRLQFSFYGFHIPRGFTTSTLNMFRLLGSDTSHYCLLSIVVIMPTFPDGARCSHRHFTFLLSSILCTFISSISPLLFSEPFYLIALSVSPLSFSPLLCIKIVPSWLFLLPQTTFVKNGGGKTQPHLRLQGLVIN